MSLLPDPSRNFLYALSGFWNTFFRDTEELHAYYEGVQINLGQIYLELLQTVLGTSLKDMPLFSRYYYKYLELRTDQLFYVEGPSPADDVYAFTPPGDVLVDVASILNRVVAPTAVLSKTRDFCVKRGELRFVRDLFNVDGAGTTEPQFPVRYTPVSVPATYRDPLGRDWAASGVKVGDWFRLRVLGGGTPILARIVGVEGDTLSLGESAPEFEQNLARRSVMVSVLRTPFNREKNGVPLAAHPRMVVKLSPHATDATLVPGAKTLDFHAEPFFKGDWTPGAAYAEGDLVHAGPTTLYRANHTHLAGSTFDPTDWDDVLGMFLMVDDADEADNNGFARCESVVGPGLLGLQRRAPFSASSSNRAALTLVAYSGATLSGSALPVIRLPHTHLDPDSFSIVARRAHARVVRGPNGELEVYPADGPVLEGVDYRVDYEMGFVTALSAWKPALHGRASYTWRREVVSTAYAFRGPWVPFTRYVAGDLVTVGSNTYRCTSGHDGHAGFNAGGDFTEYRELFSFNTVRSVPTMGLWGVNAQVDKDALYNNFGYLLDYKKPSSEQYRAFLRGVAQLFLLGPTLERFESAMNTMAGFPVVRDDGEVLRAYDSGRVHEGANGQLIDSGEGRDGTLDATLAQFSSPTANFYASDVGAVLRVQSSFGFEEYVVTTVLSPSTVTLAPAPPARTHVSWSFTHKGLTTRFRVTDGSYLFGREDVNGSIIIQGANAARNNGVFRILAVENVTTAVLETPYGFTDEEGLSWALSRTNQQTVQTSRATYEFPLLVAMRPDVVDPASVNTLAFQAFEALTDAFRVVDYLRDPTWWHHTVIPEEVLKLEVDVAGRRKVTPTLIEHIYGALDSPVYGDFGLAYDVDDEGEPGTPRAGNAWWYGGTSIVLDFPDDVPGARLRDVGQHVVVRTQGLKGSFRIEGVAPDGKTLTLDRFPPPEAADLIPPVSFDAELPPLLYRRTVAFVMMDRFLKYHAVSIRIDKNTPLPAEFIADVTRLIGEAKPSHTYIYLDSLTDFVDRLRVHEELAVGYGPFMTETLHRVPNTLVYGPPGSVRYGDAFRYVEGTTTLLSTPGTYSLPVALPPGDVQVSLVKARFDPAVRVEGGTRRPVEGVDYTVDFQNMKLSVLPSATFTGANKLHYVYCVRRLRSLTDPLDPGETRLAYGGTDPTVYRAEGQSPSELGFVDRAVQITLGP